MLTREDFAADEWRVLFALSSNDGVGWNKELRGEFGPTVGYPLRSLEKSLTIKSFVYERRNKLFAIVTDDIRGIKKAPDHKIPRERNCMVCGRQFISSCYGHRLCNNEYCTPNQHSLGYTFETVELPQKVINYGKIPDAGLAKEITILSDLDDGSASSRLLFDSHLIDNLKIWPRRNEQQDDCSGQ
jgi:transcription elongation factor Elf1